MKKAIAMALTLIFSAVLLAHPPSDIVFSADIKTGTVKLEILHQVKDASQHYIYEIEVKVNGKKAIRQDAKTQTSGMSQAVVYVIPGLKAGDKVEVYADCSKMGDLKKEFTVTETPAPAGKQSKKAPK